MKLLLKRLHCTYVARVDDFDLSLGLQATEVNALRDALDESKITFLCKFPPSTSDEVVYSYPRNVVNVPGSLCSSAALATSAHADL